MVAPPVECFPCGYGIYPLRSSPCECSQDAPSGYFPCGVLPFWWAPDECFLWGVLPYGMLMVFPAWLISVSLAVASVLIRAECGPRRVA